MADPLFAAATPTPVAVSASSIVATTIPHPRLEYLANLFGLYGDQEPFFLAVNLGNTAARKKLHRTEGVYTLTKWMEECKIELVRLFLPSICSFTDFLCAGCIT